MGLPAKATGGARIGWVNASWPLARLSVTEKELSLKVSLFGIYKFTPEQVVRLEPHGSIPLISSGIQVVHNKADSPQTLIFWCVGSRDRLLEEIRRSGFKPSGKAAAVPLQTGMPWRWSFIVAAVLLLNALFLADRFIVKVQHGTGPLSVAAMAIIFATSIGLMRSEFVQSLALKPGRSAEEILPMARLLTMISGFMLVMFAAQVYA